jgi:hypothetical protein
MTTLVKERNRTKRATGRKIAAEIMTGRSGGPAIIEITAGELAIHLAPHPTMGTMTSVQIGLRVSVKTRPSLPKQNGVRSRPKPRRRPLLMTMLK